MDTKKVEVTKVAFNAMKSGSMLGFAQVTLNDAVEIKGYKVFASNRESSGMSISPPATRDKKDEKKYYDVIAYPMTSAREAINNAIIAHVKGLENSRVTK